ncbi:MAG: hypothetical protein R3A80_10165 [Bdellovibrionota bacterium]
MSSCKTVDRSDYVPLSTQRETPRSSEHTNPVAKTLPVQRPVEAQKTKPAEPVPTKVVALPTQEVGRVSDNCPKSLSPNQTYCNIFPEGCLYVPSAVTSQPLIYIRGLIQESPRSAPESTKYLFDSHGTYHLNSVATANSQMILATHSHTTKISSSTLACLKTMNATSKVDVAAHSAGYSGLNASAGVLRGSVNKLSLLDCFYNTEMLLEAYNTIGARHCSGFYTDHTTRSGQSIVSNARSVVSKTGCDLESRTGHVSSVRPVLERAFGDTRLVNGSTQHKNGSAI